ncbi:MAG: hypothetical protein HRU19_23390 [Pseudobacteriovorax sp.]|nr:hypothetical protein [Pseudobacteriovorax sp.]
MSLYSVLISPESRSAYFNQFLEVAKEELRLNLNLECSHKHLGGMDFLDFETTKLPESIFHCSVVQGVFEIKNGSFHVCSRPNMFPFHKDLVFGSKFKGKTNEILTQLLVNLARNFAASNQPKILDPMCGRGTSLLWSLQFGLNSKGIEQDTQSVSDLERLTKKWNKIHQMNLNIETGSIGKKNKKSSKFIQISRNLIQTRLVTGNSEDAVDLLAGEKFDAIVSDLPYGIQHFAGKKRNPLDVLTNCFPSWNKLLNPGAAIVLAYNSYLPSRGEMISLCERQGWEIRPTDLEHRMSESIKRDIIIAIKPN